MKLLGQPPPAPLQGNYRLIRLEWDERFHALRLRMNVRPVPCYSLTLMSEIKSAFDRISANPGLVRHFVASSDVPGVFNFGGDLALFVLLVRARDAASLRLYARRCVDLVWWIEQAPEIGVLTTVLAQGDALGGGLESVLAFQNIVMERSSCAGFPEVLFNLFPGMGAWPFTLRRAGAAVANEMVLSGQLYAAEVLQRRGLVDHLVDDGTGELAMGEVVRNLDLRQRGLLAAFRARAIASPITYDALIAGVDLWVKAALTLTDRDLRLMERLGRAQVRKSSGGHEGAIEEIKRMELDTAWGEELSQPVPLAL